MLFDCIQLIILLFCVVELLVIGYDRVVFMIIFLAMSNSFGFAY